MSENVWNQRTLYKDRTDEAGNAISPMELQLGVIEGRWTPLAAQQATWVVAQMTPMRAEELFERMGNMTPSKSTLDRLLKALSARWEEERVDFEKALRDKDVIPQHATSVAVSLDGVLAPMNDGGAQDKRQKTAEEGRLTRGPAGYRETPQEPACRHRARLFPQAPPSNALPPVCGRGPTHRIGRRRSRLQDPRFSANEVEWHAMGA